MEYVMRRLIGERLEAADTLDIPAVNPIPYKRDYIIGVLKREYLEEEAQGYGSQEGRDYIPGWREKLESLEDLHYYENVYLWDMDYAQLDFLTEEEIGASPVSKFMGIDNVRDRKFVIPPE